MRRSLLLALAFAVTACKARPPAASTRPTARPDASVVVEPGGAMSTIVGDSRTDRALREMQDDVRRNPTRTRPLLRLAQLFVRKARESSDPGFYQLADDAVTRALRLDPNDLAAFQVRGLVLMQDHRFAEVKALAEQMLRRDANQAIFHGLLSDAEMEVGHYEAAERACQRMIDIRPNLPSYSRGSWLRWLMGDAEGAIELGRRAVEAGSPRVPEELAWTMVQYGNLHLATGNLEHAQVHFEAALRVFPAYPTALDARGVVKRLRGDLPGALTDLTAAVEGATTTENLIHLGEALESSGRREDADAKFAQAERAGRRSDPRALALFYANHDRDHDAAVALARREIETRPEDVYAQDVLAWALFRAGNLEEASRFIDRARRLGTREARFYYHAGMIALATGQRESALTLLNQALQMNAHFDVRGVDEARRTIATLEDAGVRDPFRRDASVGDASARDR